MLVYDKASTQHVQGPSFLLSKETGERRRNTITTTNNTKLFWKKGLGTYLSGRAYV